jgi:hypothetical protein
VHRPNLPVKHINLSTHFSMATLPTIGEKIWLKLFNTTDVEEAMKKCIVRLTMQHNNAERDNMQSTILVLLDMLLSKNALTRMLAVTATFTDTTITVSNSVVATRLSH